MFKKINKLIKKLFINDDIYFKKIKEAEMYIDKGEYDKAIEIYKNLLDEGYTLRAADYANLAYALLSKNNLEEALKYINKAIQLNKKNVLFYYIRGLIYYNLKRYREAYTDLIKVATKIKKHDIYKALGDILLSFGKYEEALENYLKAYKLKNSDTQVLFKIGVLYLLFGEIEKSYEIFKEIPNCKIYNSMETLLNMIRNNIFDDIERALKHLENKEYIEALKLFNKVLEYDNENDIIYYYKAVIGEEFQEYNKGLNNIDISIGIFDRAVFYSKKGDILLRMNKIEDSINEYQNSLKRFHNILAYFGLALAYFKKKDFKNASEYFDKVLETPGENVPKYLEDIIIIYSLIGKAESTGIKKYYESALEYIDKISHIDINTEIYLVKAYIYYKLGNYKIAINILNELINKGIRELRILEYLIILQTKIGRLDEALYLTEYITDEDKRNKILEKIQNDDETLQLPTPILNPPVLFYTMDIIQYHLSVLYKYLYKNPILAYIYAEFLDREVLKIIYDENVKNKLVEIIKIIKEEYPKEMYEYANNMDKYIPNVEIINKLVQIFKELKILMWYYEDYRGYYSK